MVCNYGPTGNVKPTATTSSLIYEQEKAGTACPVGTQAIPSGLCEKVTEKLEKNWFYLLFINFS